MRMARSPAIARTAGSCVGVMGTRSSSRSARRPSCARAPLESTIRRPLLRPGAPALSRPRRSIRARRARRSATGPRGLRRPQGYPPPGPETCSAPPPRPASARLPGPRACCSAAGDDHQPRQSATPPAPPGRRAGPCLLAAMEDGAGRDLLPGRLGADRSGPTPGARRLGSGRTSCRSSTVGRLRRRGRRGAAHRAARDALRPLGDGGPAATVVVRAAAGGRRPGRPAVIEHDDAAPRPWRPAGPRASSRQAQSSLLPPFLPMLPDLALSGSYHRATLGPGRRRRLVRRGAARRRAARPRRR